MLPHSTDDSFRSGTDPWVLHIDIDAFFASVEQLRNPRLARRPVAVGAGVIASCSYEAREYGLHAGMPLREAKRLCRDLEIVDGHAAIYRCFSETIFRLCRQCSPAVETYLDEAFCDLTGTERFHYHELGRDLLGLGERLKERIATETGLSTTVGLGKNRMIAKMAARSVKPDGIARIQPGSEDEFLLDLPVRELPGIGPRSGEIFEKLNIRTIAELRRLSRESLRSMFGKNGLHFFERARGNDTRPIVPREIPSSISRETSFHEETTDSGEIEGMLHYLTERAANTLRQLGLRSRQIEVKIRYGDMDGESARRRLNPPTGLDTELFETAVALHRQIHRRRVGLRLIGVSLSRFVLDGRLQQLDFFDELPPEARPPGSNFDPNSGNERRGSERRGSEIYRPVEERRKERGLLDSLDAIRKRYGHASVVCGRSLHLLGKLEQDTHGFVLRTPSLTL